MDFITVVILWILFSALVAYMGSTRKIGAMGAFAVSFVLSPLIGLLIVAFSKSVNQQASSVSDELSKLDGLRKEGVLSEDEFNKQKARILK